MISKKTFILGIVLLFIIQPVLSFESDNYIGTRTTVSLTGVSNGSSENYTFNSITYFQQPSGEIAGDFYNATEGFLSHNYCGDGVNGVNEECDDANLNNNDDCLVGCILNKCGDGFINIGVEECDDGNLRDGDGCSAACNVEANPNPISGGGGGGGQNVIIIVSPQGEYEIYPDQFDIYINRGQLILREIEIKNVGVTTVYFNISLINKTNDNIAVWFSNNNDHFENYRLDIPFGLESQTAYFPVSIHIPSDKDIEYSSNESFVISFDDGAEKTYVKFNVYVKEDTSLINLPRIKDMLNNEIFNIFNKSIKFKHIILVVSIVLLASLIFSVLRNKPEEKKKPKKVKENENK